MQTKMNQSLNINFQPKLCTTTMGIQIPPKTKLPLLNSSPRIWKCKALLNLAPNLQDLLETTDLTSTALLPKIVKLNQNSQTISSRQEIQVSPAIADNHIFQLQPGDPMSHLFTDLFHIFLIHIHVMMWYNYSYIDDNVWKIHRLRASPPPQREKNRQLPDRYSSPHSEKTLGKGTFGKVKLATHIPTG